MNDRIARLRELSRLLEPGPELREEWNQKVLAQARTFIESIDTGPAFCAAAGEGRGILDSPLGEEPEDAAQVLELFGRHVQEPGGRLGAPGFMGFIPISSLYSAALGDYLAAVVNPFAGNFFASPGAVRVEHLLTRWMAGLVGYPATAAGDLTSGGSMSNLSAIVTAREARALKARDYGKAVVYLSSQTHHSVAKALRIAGMGECVQRMVPVDANYRMRPEVLAETIRQDKSAGLMPWLVVPTAGSTDVGAVDPLPAIAHVAQRHALWLHVDGAYGAMFALCDEGRKTLAGMELSDSLTLDPHKGLFMPCGLGALLVRNGAQLREAFRYDAHYMQDRAALASLEETSPSELSPELTRPFRGLRLWLSLKLIGVRAFRAALEEKLLLARYFHERAREIPGIEVGPPPDLSVVIFRAVPQRGDANDYNRAWLHRIQKDGRIFITSTTLDGKFWLRMAVLCAATHQEHIDLALEMLKENHAR